MAETLISVRPDPAVYKIRNKKTKTNLNLAGGAGTNLTGWSNSDSTDQQWQLAHLGNGEYSIISNARGFLASATKGAEQPATAEFLPPNNKKVRWVFDAVGTAISGNYFIRSVEKTELVLDLFSSGSANGTGVYTWPQHAKPEDWQIWNLEKV